MKKKVIAAILAAGLVLGMFGISSAQPANDFTNESIQENQETAPEESAADGQQPAAMALTADGAMQVSNEEELRSAAESGGSILVTQDITLEAPVTVPAGANVELDLGGHTITAEFANPLVNEGTMSVHDSVGGAAVSAPRGCLRNLGSLSIYGGHYTTTDDTGGSALFNGAGATMAVKSCVVDAASFAIGNAGDCTIDGGQLHSTSSNATPNWAYCIKSTGAGARLVINNATVTGIQGGVAAVQGTVEINGGNFSTEQGNSRSFYALYVAGEDGEVNGDVYGGTFLSPRQAVYIGNDNTNGDGGINASACLRIHGGTFEGGNSALFKSQNTGTTFISGGTFRDGTGDSNIADYVIDGYEAVRGEDGSVSVEQKQTPVRNETTGEMFETLQKAIDAATEGDTIRIQANVGVYDEAVTLNKAVTLEGPGDGSTVLTGGITLAGPFGDDTRTVIRGLKFEKSGIYAIAWGNEPNLNNLTIENNTFENISDWSAAINFNLDNKSAPKNLTIADNTISNVTAANGSGIWVSATAGTTRITGNRISNTTLNSIQITGMAGGDVTISGNILQNWDCDVAGGGRAMRLTANGNASMSVTGNSMSRTLAAGEDGAQAIKITELTGTLDASKNYWNAAKPDFSEVLRAYQAGGEAAGSAQLVTMPYYADAELTKLVEYGVKNARSGETYETLQKAVNKALAGDTLLLGDDVSFGTTTQTGYDEDGIGYGTYGSFGKSLTIRGEGAARTITATSIITVNNGAQVTLENVTVDGENRIGTSGINVQGSAALTLNEGAVVRGCATSSGRSAVGVGSVGGTGGAGKLVMNEGSLITQNINSGVWLEADGILEMNGGAISGNNCQPTALSKQAYGLVISGGKAVMNGGEISANGASIAGGGVSMSKSGSTLTVNGGVIANNTKNGSIYVTATDCTVTLHDAVVTGNAVGAYGSVGGSSSATNLKVNISGNTQITGNKYGSTACNLKTSANMAVDITGLEEGAMVGITPQGKAAGYEIAGANDIQSVRTACFALDSALNANVSLVRIGNKLLTGYATTTSAAGLSGNQFEYTGTAPALQMKDLSVVAANGAAVQNPIVGFVYYADDNGAAGSRLAAAPTASGTYWAWAVYEGDAARFYGVSEGAEAYQYRIVIPVANVSLNKADISLEMNAKGQLSASVSPADAYDKSIVWASSDESVVKVDKGLLTPVAPGTATVTAAAHNGKSASCMVTITAQPAPVLPDTEGKTQIVVEPEVQDNTVDAGAVKDALASAQPDEAVVVRVEVKDADEAQDVRVSADVVALAAKSAAEGTGAKTVVFSMTDAGGNIVSAVTFDLVGGVAAGPLADINLGHTNMVSPDVEDGAKQAISEDAVVLFINLAHDGQFPCPVTRMDQVGGSFRPGDTVYLYWVSPTDGLLEEQELTVDENGYITYTITHASPYLVTNRRSMAGQPQEPGDPNGTQAPGTDDPGNSGGTQGTDNGNGRPAAGNDGAGPVGAAADGPKATTAPRTDDGQDLAPYLWLAALMGGAAAIGAGVRCRRRKEERE
ncbi:Ig-like domain-containing protein [Christensenella timonensis]|uniref:Ig-like domain-containing protein n=1 Tax=Christensenella timonensis TaxID=1816678 RepID=UPI0008340882|nr:Ig-like domain-containing protein [Christensenella timonensis]